MIAPTTAGFSDLSEFEIGQTASSSHTITSEVVDAFARFSGDHNAVHMDEDYARAVGFNGRVSHGAILVAYLSNLLGTKLPGQGCYWIQQQIFWRMPVYLGNTIVVTVKVKHKSLGTKTLTLTVDAKNQDGAVVMDGQAVVAMPAKTAQGWSGNG
jgi:acyl dehydratase